MITPLRAIACILGAILDACECTNYPICACIDCASSRSNAEMVASDCASFYVKASSAIGIQNSNNDDQMNGLGFLRKRVSPSNLECSCLIQVDKYNQRFQILCERGNLRLPSVKFPWKKTSVWFTRQQNPVDADLELECGLLNPSTIFELLIHSFNTFGLCAATFPCELVRFFRHLYQIDVCHVAYSCFDRHRLQFNPHTEPPGSGID